jgi:MinD superfamily P-loop ATPase
VNPAIAAQIEQECMRVSVPVIGRIPYDQTVVEAVNACQSIARYPDSKAGAAIASIWLSLHHYI